MFVASSGVYSMKNPHGAGVSDSGSSIVSSGLSDVLPSWVRSMSFLGSIPLSSFRKFTKLFANPFNNEFMDSPLSFRGFFLEGVAMGHATSGALPLADNGM